MCPKIRRSALLLFFIVVAVLSVSCQVLSGECEVVDCASRKTFTIYNVQLPTRFFPEGAI